MTDASANTTAQEAAKAAKFQIDDPHAMPMEAETMRVRSLKGVWRWLLIAAAAGSLFLCMNQQFNWRFFVSYTFLNTEYFYLLIALLLPFTFLIFPASPKARLDRVPWYDVLLFVLTVAVSIYLMTKIRKSAELGWEMVGGNPPETVVWTGYFMWAILMEALRRTGGWSLMLSILPFTFYPLVAGWMPSPFKGHQSTLGETSAYHVLSNESLLGIPIQAFADLVIGFLIFGTALTMTGAGRFFINLSFALCGTFRGGAAKVCIFASALLGMMSGSIISNVLTAGTMTIPVMKKTGFRASYAGAIEACASTGAVLAPPVMGATAFVMAQFLNVSYGEVALAAIIPAALYYFGLYMQVDSYAARHGMKGIPREQLPKLGETFKDGWYFVFVIALLIFMLLVMKRESHAPFYATGLLLILNQLFNKDRWKGKDVVKFFEANGKIFVELVGILAGCGLLIGAFSATGVIGSLAGDLVRIAGNSPMLLLLIGAATSFILGLGLTTTACYIFLAVLLAPALQKAGLNVMAIHMFIFYWGMLSSITPPVAIASFAAAGIAGAPAMKTGWESMWVGSIIYFIPFFFVLNPALLLQGNFLESIYLTVTVGLGIVPICGGIQGNMLGIGDLRRAGALEWPLRVMLIVGGIVLATPGGGIMPLSNTEMELLAAAILAPTIGLAWLVTRRNHTVILNPIGFGTAQVDAGLTDISEVSRANARADRVDAGRVNIKTPLADSGTGGFKIAAMIIGALSALGLLTYSLIAMLAGDFISAVGGDGGFVKLMGIAIPAVALIGAGVVLSRPLVGGGLMVGSAALIIFWLGLNSFTIFLGLPLLIAGCLGIAGYKNVAAISNPGRI